MRQLIRTELLKLATTRAFKGIVAGAFLFTIFRFVMVVESAGKIEAAPLGTAASTRDLMMTVGTGTILFLVIGILSVSTEVRHGTIGWTFLATPVRWRVLAAKVATVAIVALAYTLLVTGVVLGLTAALFAREGIPLDAVNRELVSAMAGAVVALPVYAVMGVGLGALIPDQIAALLIPLSWLLIVENLLPSYGLVGLVVWLPGGATAALARADLPGLLPVWGGALLLLAYAAGAVAAGGKLLARRDVT